jgi:hypothetical protein
MMEHHEPNKMNELVVFCERVRNGEDDAFCASCKSALQDNYVPGAHFEGNQ